MNTLSQQMIPPYVLQMIVSPKLLELVLRLEHRVTWNVMVGLQLKQVAPALRTIECELWGPHAADDPEAFKSFFALLQTREKATGTRLEDLRVSSCAADILKTILNPRVANNIIAMDCPTCEHQRRTPTDWGEEEGENE